jgi:hypothetical protein
MRTPKHGQYKLSYKPDFKRAMLHFELMFKKTLSKMHNSYFPTLIVSLFFYFNCFINIGKNSY